MDSNNNRRTILQYEIGKTLGSGMSGKVKLGYDMNSGRQVALKLIRRDTLKDRAAVVLQREIKIMETLSHQNVVNLIEVDYDAEYPRKNGGTRRVIVMVIELCSGGELFDFLMYTGGFQEVIARTYFKQLLNVLAICHSQGIYHRDLKPENLLLDEKFQLKVADFGLSYMCNQEELSSEQIVALHTQCGTQAYMAPEVLSVGSYSGALADVWSAGVVLFILLSGNPPFAAAKRGDWWFEALSRGQYDRFWQAHLRSCPNFPAEARPLINKIFTVDPTKRPSVEELLNDPWLQGQTYQEEELFRELNRRRQIVVAKKEEERLAAIEKKKREHARVGTQFTRTTVRAFELQAPEVSNDGVLKSNENYFSESASSIFEKLQTICQQLDTMKSKLDVRENEFKIKSSVEKENIGKIDFSIQVYSLQGSDGLNTVQIVKKGGDYLAFRDLENDIISKLVNLLAEQQLQNQLLSNNNSGESEAIITDDLGML